VDEGENARQTAKGSGLEQAPEGIPELRQPAPENLSRPGWDRRMAGWDIRAAVRRVLRRSRVRAEDLEAFVEVILEQAESLYGDWPGAA
jgi:hypothetical protein